jgi:citronellol/citronellal dehydrogenase
MPSSSLLPLAGRVALVTGASRGIGKEISLELARQGCYLVLSARTITAREGIIGSLEATRQLIEVEGGKAQAVEADLSVDQDLKRLHAQSLGFWGKVDILVNNAAVMLYHVPFFEADVGQFDEEFRVNVRAPFVLTQLFGQDMADQGGGVIINISSRTAESQPPPEPGQIPRPSWSSITYGPTKAALNRLSTGLARELLPANVAVVTLYPGFTRTERMEAEPPPGLDLRDSESADGLAAAVVRICQEPMRYTGRVLSWRDVQD